MANEAEKFKRIAQKPTAERLRELFELAELSQREVARRGEFHFTAVNFWLSDGEQHREPRLASYRKLYDVLASELAGLELDHVIGTGAKP